jgi:hypothetical protein
MSYPNSEEEDQPPYKGHAYDPDYTTSREALRDERNADIAASKKRLKQRVLGGYQLPSDNPDQQRWAKRRIRGLDNRTIIADPERPLDKQWLIERGNPYAKNNMWNLWGILGCKVCEKINTPLFHCAECMDSTYCSQQCQIQGCGKKHL